MKKFSRKVRKAVRVLCSRELVLAKRENEKLAYKVQKLEMELDNSTDTIASMSKANKNLKKQIEFLESRVNDLKNSLCDAIGESERRYDKIVELTQNSESIQKKLDEASKPWYKRWFKC